MEEAEAVLAHYGVKGMRWGVRRRRSESSGGGEAEDVKIETAPGKIRVSGGKNLPVSDDAKRAAAYRQKAKASSVHSLSNQELKALTERMGLEKKYRDALENDVQQKSKGKQFVSGLFDQEVKPLLKGNRGPITTVAKMILDSERKRRKVTT